MSAPPVVVSAPRPAVSAPPVVVSASQPAVSAPPVVVSAPAPAVSASWLAAYQEAQRATAEAHGVYQRTMAESHIAFLQAAEASFAGLAALATGAPYTAAAAAPAARPAPMLLAPVHAGPISEATLGHAGALTSNGRGSVGHDYLHGARGEHPAAVVTSAPAAAAKVTVAAPAPAVAAKAAAAAPAPAVAAPVRVAAAPDAAASAKPAAPAAATQAAVAASGVELERLVLEVVADKTGYPVSMLGLEMELESDLGIDSIKRVEILSSVRDRTPGLSEVDASALAQLRTLGQVVEHLRASLPAAPAAAAVTSPAAGARPAVTAAPAVASAPAPAASAEVERVVMAV
ncbi:phosphopantetheine-binding protein, partial [Sorangium cellulosum]|uniref:phosphopantetheine-binding protein n=1 Tax=Sorangium cellulosum TaxID=56 RepID=UPI001F32D5A9